MPFHDIMVDLETLGNRAGCAPLSLGAQPFDPETGEVSPCVFYEEIDTDSCILAGLTFHQSTIDWWTRQAPEVRAVVGRARSGECPHLLPVLQRFNAWLRTFGGQKELRIWGNGAAFDQPIMTAAYAAVRLEPAWEFYNERCYRTLKNLRPDIEAIRQGHLHNALDDAKTQAEHAVRLFAALGPALRQAA